MLVSSDQREFEGRAFVKSVDGEFLLGLLVTDPLGVSSIRTVVLDVDRDGSGDRSDGDARLVFDLPQRSSSYDEASPLLYRYRNGEYARADVAADDFGTLALQTGESGTTVEAWINTDLLDEVFGDAATGDDGERIGVDVELRGGDERFVLERFDDRYSLTGIDLGVDHVEVTQAVQTRTNDLRLVRQKETLARTFVTHNRSGSVSVRVTYRAWGISGGTRTYLGSRSVTFSAPPGTPDRTDLNDSANLELPAAWVDVGRLELRASATAPGNVDLSTGNDAVTVRKRLFVTRDLAIYRIRVNLGTASSPQQSSVAQMNLVSSGLADSFPVAQPQFRTLGWETIGVQSGNRDAMIADLDAAGNRLRAAWILSLVLTGSEPSIPLPDQVYGIAQIRGLSDPRWAGSSYDSLAGLCSFFRVTMAHEVNHNIGNNTWGRHVAGSGFGCGAGGPDARWDSLFNDDNIRALGWEPGNGLVATTKPDVMSYCTTGRWMSDYRWELLLDRLRGFQASQPIHPDLLSLQPTALEPSGKTVLGREVPTVRVITGALHANGSATLDPTFEQPGVVRDNGTIDAIAIVDARTEEVLAGRESSGFEFDGAKIGVPEAFARNESVAVGIDVSASTDGLHKQLLYTPDPESGLWYPYGQSFTGDRFLALFSELPGGQNARFLLLVSDGVRTRFATSPAFEVPRLPPTVTIDRNDRWVAEDTGPRFDHAFADPGTYRVRVTALDAATELTATDGIQVEVELPPLPSRTDVRAFRTAIAAATGGGSGPRLSLQPTPQSVAAGGTVSYDLVFDPASDGVGTYDLNVSVSNASVATIDGVRPRLGPNPTAPATFSVTTVAADGSTVRIQQVGVQSSTGTVTLATVTLAGQNPGNASLAFSNVVVGDRNDSQYAIDVIEGATLTVRSAPVAPDVNGNGLAATDPDGDDLYEDVNRDRKVNIIDVAMLLGLL